jgi:hypothetical protein
MAVPMFQAVRGHTLLIALLRAEVMVMMAALIWSLTVAVQTSVNVILTRQTVSRQY